MRLEKLSEAFSGMKRCLV